MSSNMHGMILQVAGMKSGLILLSPMLCNLEERVDLLIGDFREKTKSGQQANQYHSSYKNRLIRFVFLKVKVCVGCTHKRPLLLVVRNFLRETLNHLIIESTAATTQINPADYLFYSSPPSNSYVSILHFYAANILCFL